MFRRHIKRFVSTFPRSIGKIHFPKSTSDPQLVISAPTLSSLNAQQDIIVSIKPWYTISHLKYIIRKEDCAFELKSVLSSPGKSTSNDQHDLTLVKYANETTLSDVIKNALNKPELSIYLQLRYPKRNAPISSSNSVSQGNDIFLGAASSQESQQFISNNSSAANEKILLAHFDLQSLDERLADYKEEEQALKADLEPLTKLKEQCDKSARSHANRLVWGGLLGLSAEWVVLARLTWWEYSWDVIEPITWFVGMGNTVLAYAFYVIYRKDFSCEVLNELTATKKQLALYKKRGLDIEKWSEKTALLRNIQTDISRITTEYGNIQNK